MRTPRALSCIALLGAAGCSSPPPSPTPPPSTAPATTESQSATAASTAAPATTAARELACAGRRRIGNVSFAPDGQSFTTACMGYQVCEDEGGGGSLVDVWSVRQGKIERSLQAGMGNVTWMLWGQGGSFATVADPSTSMCAVRLFTTAAWEKKAALEYYCVSGAAFDPGGTTLAVAGCDGHIAAIQTATGKVVNRPEKEAHAGGDYHVGVEFSADGKALFVDDESEGYQELDPATLKRKVTRHPASESPCAASSPNGDLRATLLEDGTLTVTDTKARGKPRTLAKEAAGPCTRMTWVDAARLVIALSDGAVALWDTSGKGTRRVLSPPSPGTSPVTVTMISPAPGGSAFVSADSAGVLALWDVATGTRRALSRPWPPKQPDMAPPITWSPGGERFAALLGDRVVVYDARAAGAVAELPAGAKPDDQPPRIQWSPTGAFLAVADGTLRLLRLADGEKLTLSTVDYQGARLGIAGSPSGVFAGPPDLAHCVVPAAVPADRRAQRQGLLADFLAGKPLKAGP